MIPYRPTEQVSELFRPRFVSRPHAKTFSPSPSFFPNVRAPAFFLRISLDVYGREAAAAAANNIKEEFDKREVRQSETDEGKGILLLLPPKRRRRRTEASAAAAAAAAARMTVFT